MNLIEPPGGSPRDFGPRIRKWRDLQGLTLAQLAEKSGLSTGYLSLLERGQKIPSPEAAASLARALGDDEGLYRSWAAAMRAGVPTSDVVAMVADTRASLAYVREPLAMSASPAASMTFDTPAPEPDVVAVRVLPTHADPADPDTYSVSPLYLDRRFIGAEPGDRLFAYEITPEAAALLDDVAAAGDHIIFSSRVSRITPTRVYAVLRGGRVVAARLGLVDERIVIVPPAGERDVEMVEGEWRDVVRGVAVVVIRRLLPSRPSSDRRPRPGGLDDSASRADLDAGPVMERLYRGTIEGVIRRSSLAPDERARVERAIWEKLSLDDAQVMRRWNEDGSLVPYLARVALDATPPGALGPLEILRDRDRTKAIEHVMGLLSPRDRDLLCRRYVLEEPNADIADALGMSLSAVHVALHRARARFDRVAADGDTELLRPLIERMGTSG